MTDESTRIPKFITKIFDILENNEFPEALQWNAERATILIKSITELEKVLPCLFKHKNITSFIRQLNLYGFKKLKSGSSQHAYYHEFFRSGKRNLLRLINRKRDEVAEEYAKTFEGNSEEEETVMETEKYEPQRENGTLKRVHQDLVSRVNALESQLKQFAEQNMLLVQLAMKKETEIISLKNLIAAKASGENSPYFIIQGIKTPETSSSPVKKVLNSDGAFKSSGTFKVSSKHSMIPFGCQNSAFVSVKRTVSLQDNESSDSDRKSEENNVQDSLAEEQKGCFPIQV
jgi:hypothetical protein